MSGSIDRDKQRFIDITKDRTRKRLKDMLKRGEIIGKRDGKIVKVPYDVIELPRIKYHSGEGGEGGEGDGSGDGDHGEKKPSDEIGEHELEAFDLEELAEELLAELELPKIEPKGCRMIQSHNEKLKTINRVGPQGRIHKKRTFKNALKRSMASGSHYPGKIVSPVRPDRRYRSFKPEFTPEMNAVIFYIMDVSGSMGQEQKEMVRTMSFWVDLWLSKNYKAIESRYIIHDAAAKEVDRDTFFTTREAGGTMISSAYLKTAEILQDNYKPEEWNIYILQGSDGDNWSKEDTSLCFQILNRDLLPHLNLLGYVQTRSPYGSGQYLQDIIDNYNLKDENSKILTTEIADKAGIFDSIKDIFGKGK
jgi:hypothetical protein